jgi:hypothetical protein
MGGKDFVCLGKTWLVRAVMTVSLDAFVSPWLGAGPVRQ